MDGDKLDTINQKLRSKAREESKIVREISSSISANVKKRFGNKNEEHNSQADPGDYNEEMSYILGKKTLGDNFSRKIHSSSKEQEFYYDPKTGRKIKIGNEAWSPSRREKSKFLFADNPVPHGENCGPNCSHMLKANGFQKPINRKILHMNTANMVNFSDI